MIQSPSIRRALALSVLLHALGALVASAVVPSRAAETELVDIEIAPPPPKAEALPPEVAKPPEQDLGARTEPEEPASMPPEPPREGLIDAGIDATIDARVDAAVDAAIDAPPDAAPDAMAVAMADPDKPLEGDAGVDATEVALADAGDAPQIAAGSGSGAGSDAKMIDAGALALAEGSGSGVPGLTDEVAVDGAPTTAGTAANLLAYFPQGHVVTALIRFDRLRGTEWAEQTERLLRPMPDYQLLFGIHEPKITDKLETLIISSPKPRDAAATTLVARTLLGRAELREFLGATTAVTWSGSKGGLLGKRTGKVFPGDKRVFLSPFKGWFLLAQPTDLGSLTSPAKGNFDALEATAKLPPWLAGIRKIETESGDKRGPALVLTLGLGGKRVDLKDNDFGLGLATVPTPDRVSLAMELVKQGWLVRGNLRFANDADAAEFIASAQRVQQRIADSHAIQLLVGKPVVRVVANLSFAQAGPRVSYATSVSIADARAIMAAAAQQLDQYYGRAP